MPEEGAARFYHFTCMVEVANQGQQLPFYTPPLLAPCSHHSLEVLEFGDGESQLEQIGVDPKKVSTVAGPFTFSWATGKPSSAQI